MADMKIYDASEISVVAFGIPIDSGFADGEFVRIEQMSQDFETVVGTDGEVTRSKTNDKRAKITIRLMQTSKSNALLSAVNLLDKTAPNGAGVGPFMVRDRQGTSLYAAAKCWIAKPPDPSFDRTAKEREWQLECADLERLDGGN